MRRSFYTTLITIYCTLCIFAVSVMHGYAAQTVDELQSNLSSLSAQIKALDKEIKDFNDKIGKTQGEAKTLKAALQSLENRRLLLAKQIDRTKLEITEAEKNISSTVVKLTTTEEHLKQDKSGLAESLRSIVYADSQLSPFLGVLASRSTRLSDALDSITRSGEASKAIHEKVKNLTDTKEALDIQKKLFETNKEKLLSLNEVLSDQQTLVLQTAQDKNTLLAQTKNKETEYQKLLSERKAKKGDLEAEMLDVESKIKTAVDATKLPKYGKGVLLYPVDNVKITQYFGNTEFSTKNPQVYNGSGHNGIDFGVPVGTPIYAAQAGTVLGTGNTDASCTGVSYGKWVLIQHANGLTSLYAHLSSIQVTQGQQVTARQKIALSGNTGYSTGPHLHFTVYASDSVHISGPTEYKSRVCGTYMVMPLAPRAGYLNPLSYL